MESWSIRRCYPLRYCQCSASGDTPYPNGMPKLQRKGVTERLLRVRLGLDQDWLNRDEQGLAQLPTALPRFIAQEHSGREIKELEGTLDRLIAAGCRRGVLIFCLQQLSPEAKEVLAGRELKFAPGKDGADEVEQKRLRPLGTREHLEAVSNSAEKLTRLVGDYRRELLMAAEAGQPADVSTMLNDFKLTDEDETFSLLLKLLAWVRELADSYAAPYEELLMQSKELLYLTLYVSMHASIEKLKSSQRRADSQMPATRRGKERRARRYVHPDHALAYVATFCTGRQWAPSDLLANLKRFRTDYPALYKEMARKMEALHNSESEQTPIQLR